MRTEDEAFKGESVKQVKKVANVCKNNFLMRIPLGSQVELVKRICGLARSDLPLQR